MRYELLCDKCGRSYPVETRQAGGTIECECGAALSIPTMLKMKRLPEWNEAKESGETPAEQEPQTLDSANASEPAEVETPVEERAEPSRPSRRKKLSSKRRALFCFCAVIVIGSLFVVGKNLKTPPPTQVFYKNTVYSLGDGRAIKRDTTPITMEDYSFYFATDFSDPSLPTALVNDYYIDYMPPFEAYRFFDYVKELRMSDNFYDNYDSIKTRRWLRLGLSSVIALLALAGALFALFAPESTKQVGAMRGADWR